MNINTNKTKPEHFNYIGDLCQVNVEKLPEFPNSKLPEYQQVGDVAADVFAAEDILVPANGRALIKLGIKLMLPTGYRAKLHSRSGLSRYHGIEVGAGLIDCGHREGIGVMLYNHTSSNYQVKVGDRVAQLAIEQYTHALFVEKPVPPNLRSPGWGSSGNT